MKKIILFTAKWCGACKKLTETLNGYNLTMPILVYDYDQTPEPFVQYKIKEVPTMVMIEDELVIKKMTGAKKLEELNEWFNT